MIKLAIFDLDGVITSTASYHFKAWERLFKEMLNVEIDQTLEHFTRGVSRCESLNVLLEKSHVELNETLKKKYCEIKNEMYVESIKDISETDVLPGVVEFLKMLKKEGILIALASASKNAQAIIKQLKIEELFDYCVDPSLHPSKPAPDIFKDAMHYYDLDPQECIGFEDAKAGIKAIKSAGMLAVGVGDTPLVEADFNIRSFRGLEYDLWQKMIS